MKRKTISLCLSIACCLSIFVITPTLTSCSSDKAEPTALAPVDITGNIGAPEVEQRLNALKGNIDLEKIKSIENLSYEGKLLAYNQLFNSSERYYVWVKKMNNVLKYYQGNAKKQALIKELAVAMRPEIYDKPKEAAEFLSSFMSVWTPKAISEFGTEKTGIITGTFEQLEYFDKSLAGESKNARTSSGECNCGGSDQRLDRCGALNQCWTGNGCYETWWGCGDLLLQRCDGRCTYFV